MIKGITILTDIIISNRASNSHKKGHNNMKTAFSFDACVFIYPMFFFLNNENGGCPYMGDCVVLSPKSGAIYWTAEPHQLIPILIVTR